MTPQERELILSVAQRLRGAPPAEKDAEAQRLIQAEIGPQRDALYLLTQSVIVQDLGLQQAQERVRQLEAELASAKQQGAGAAPKQGSFLGGAFGGGSPQASPTPSAPAATAQPAPASSPPSAAPSSGLGGVGIFLTTAAAAAAGAAGGQLMLDGVRRVLGGGPGSPASGGGGLPGGADPPSGRTPPGGRRTRTGLSPQAAEAAGRPPRRTRAEAATGRRLTTRVGAAVLAGRRAKMRAAAATGKRPKPTRRTPTRRTPAGMTRRSVAGATSDSTSWGEAQRLLGPRHAAVRGQVHHVDTERHGGGQRHGDVGAAGGG